MEENEGQKISWSDVLNSLIGGIICFFMMIILTYTMRTLFNLILLFLGIIGVTAFDLFKIAHAIIFFGIVYLICGFLGGLYTGYKVEARLNLFLFITASIGFTSFIILSYFLGRLTLPSTYIDVIIPALAGSFIGVYLGGYTIIWPYRHKEETSTPNINLDFGGGKTEE